MKIIPTLFICGFIAVVTRADTPLTVSSALPSGCLQNAFIYPTPLVVTSTFSLTGVSGTGTMVSEVTASAPTFSFPPEAYFFNYSINVSGMASPSSHCLKLLVHFGTPDGCGYDEVFDPSSAIQSATLATFGDITFNFTGGCLAPGHPAAGFVMFSEAIPKTNIVTVIDDYFDPVSGQTNETRVNVAAIVPDVPPNPPWWVFYHPLKVPYAFFQGSLDNNTDPPPVAGGLTGGYNFTMQLLTAPSNGLAASQVVTQNVQVVNGLFNTPLPFDAVAMCDGSARWLSIGVTPTINPGPPQFLPPLPITPTPQAFYAYSAGVVADLTPGQAVTSLNGLTDAVNLAPGNGIFFNTNGNTLTIGAIAGVGSDRNIKTAFAHVQPGDILDRLAALPIESWRYTNEVAGIRHVGPMAQDFQAAFGLGTDDKMIYYVDESGVALAAIQGLNQKLNEKDTEIKELKAQLDELKLAVKQLAQPPTK